MSSEPYTPLPYPPIGAAGNSNWLGNLNQADFEIAFFERVLSRNPDNIHVLRALGEQLARKGLWERSLKVEEHMIRLRPDDGIAHYNVACSLAMQGAASQAIEALDRAIHCGYRDFGHLEVDPDLDSLRNLPAYRALLGRHAPRN
jgi:tetratricopeptide (TPR) repeat protein